MTIASHVESLDSLREEQALLRSRLARLRLRLRLQMALEFALDAVAVMVATAALLVLLDWWFRLGSSARMVVLAVSLLGIVPFQAIRAARRWRASQLDDLSLAMTIDRFRPGTGGQVADVLQLPDLLDARAASVSPAMVRLAVRRASEALAASDWATLWNRGRTAGRGLALGVALLIPALFFILAPDAARLSVARWLFGSNERWPQRTYLSVSGLDDRNRLLAPRDEPFALEVQTNMPYVTERGGRWFVRGRGEVLALRNRPMNPVSPAAVRVRERTAKGAIRDAIMTSTGPATLRHELPPSSSTTTIELTGGDDWLGPLTVQRVDRPSLASTVLRFREAGSPGNEFKVVDASQQHPVFLPDTEIEMTFLGSEPIAEVHLTVHPGPPPPLTRVDPRSFVARWTLREATTLEIQLTSQETGLTSNPAFRSIGLLKDREPRVALRALGVGAHVTPVATIPLSVSATDDLGLAALRLQTERTTTIGDKAEPKTTRKAIPLTIPDHTRRAVLDHQERHDVTLQADPPPVGTILRFVAEAEDQCARGTQVGRSTVLQMQVVPADELFYEILIRQRAERTKFVAILETVEKWTPTLAAKASATEYANIVRSLHAGSRQLDLIAGRITETLQEMKLNQVGSPKSHRLLQQGVIDPIHALNTGPVNELRGVLQSLAGASAKAGADAQSARRLHADILTRMKAILEQMSQWESFVDVVNQVAEVIKMQQNVLQDAERARKSRTEEVFDAKP